MSGTRVEDFKATYHRMSTDELARIAAEFHELRPEAQRALLDELNFRGLKNVEISVLLDRSTAWLEGIDWELTRAMGSVESVNGTGRTFYGKKNHQIDVDSGFEEFDTTLWKTLFFIPIFRVGQFRIRRRLSKGLSLRVFEYPFVVIRRLPD